VQKKNFLDGINFCSSGRRESFNESDSQLQEAMAAARYGGAWMGADMVAPPSVGLRPLGKFFVAGLLTA
jgi:hypothetical protein